MTDLEITYQSPEALKPFKNNARTHSEKQINQIAASIKKFGFNTPILVDDNNQIIAGHGRLKAAQLIGMKHVPTLRLSHMNEAQKRAYIIADNKLAELSGWDNEILAIEFQYFDGLELDFELEITGFETSEIDLVIEGLNDDSDTDDDFPQPNLEKPAVTKPGDLYILGGHRLFCGNSLEESSYAAVIANEKARAVFTDPPYNVPINGHVGGLGSIKHREFAMASGEMSEEEFTKFLAAFITLTINHSVDGSLHYICMDWRHIFELLKAGLPRYSELKNICAWVKDNGGMGSLYRSRHELVAVFKNGTAPHTNNIQLGKHGRYRTNVWEYAGVNGFANRDNLKMHPTVKPVAMISDAIKDCTKRGDIVLDPFTGSGSTLIACEKSHRQARCIEIDPHYCDVIIRRWQMLTKLDARHEVTNKTFNEQENDYEHG